ncbi:hypothetical protein HZA96_03030 [Candidatus Woesearchaeota archaeon]|nr:hypothetical protein [Candidatus Woesearchaeota archaeon]
MNKKGVYSLLIVVLVVVVGALALLSINNTDNILTGSVVLDIDEKTFSDCMNIEAQKLGEYNNVETYCKCKAEEKKGCDLYLKQKNSNNCEAGYLPEFQCEKNSRQKDIQYQKYQFADCKTKSVPVKECNSGCAGDVCANQACTDTDGGNKPYIGGTVKGNNKFDQIKELSDICTSADTLREFYCKNDVISDMYTACSFGCDKAKAECIVAPCTDTDDGQAIYKAGTTTGAVFGESIDVKTVKDDVCANSKQLKEYYCHLTGAVSAVTVDCTYGCSEGKCTAPTG